MRRDELVPRDLFVLAVRARDALDSIANAQLPPTNLAGGLNKRYPPVNISASLGSLERLAAYKQLEGYPSFIEAREIFEQKRKLPGASPELRAPEAPIAFLHAVGSFLVVYQIAIRDPASVRVPDSRTRRKAVDYSERLLQLLEGGVRLSAHKDTERLKTLLSNLWDEQAAPSARRSRASSGHSDLKRSAIERLSRTFQVQFGTGLISVVKELATLVDYTVGDRAIEQTVSPQHRKRKKAI